MIRKAKPNVLPVIPDQLGAGRRIDWPALSRDVAFKLAGNWRQHWFALQQALAAEGLDFHRDTLRAIGRGRRRPSDPDLVA